MVKLLPYREMLQLLDNQIKYTIMKKVSILYITLFIATISSGLAQQLQSSAFFEANLIMQNPAYSGISNKNVVGINYRNQWASLNAGPKTVSAYGTYAMSKHKMGLSGFVYNDVTGPTSRTGIAVSVAKYINFENGSKLSFGIENRFQQFLLNTSKLTEYLGVDPAIGNANKKVSYDAGFGIAYTHKKLQIGASVAQMLQGRFDNYTGNLNRSQEARLYRHYYLNANYEFNLDETVSMVPNFMMIYFPNAPVEYFLGSRFKYQDLCWLGLGMSFSGNVNFGFGLNATKAIRVDYAFDFYNNPNNKFNVNAHELMVQFNLTK